MEEIHIDFQGFESSQKLRQHIVRRFQSEFGLKQYMISKINIRLSHGDSEQDEMAICCRVQADIKNQPVVITELISENVITAIDLAIEHANLKLSHRINGNKEFRKRLENKKKRFLQN
ncbi:MAG: HPF/RaiA family ribosome-associated protein [Gammaproteobacteria bacterium]